MTKRLFNDLKARRNKNIFAEWQFSISKNMCKNLNKNDPVLLTDIFISTCTFAFSEQGFTLSQLNAELHSPYGLYIEP